MLLHKPCSNGEGEAPATRGFRVVGLEGEGSGPLLFRITIDSRVVSLDSCCSGADPSGLTETAWTRQQNAGSTLRMARREKAEQKPIDVCQDIAIQDGSSIQYQILVSLQDRCFARFIHSYA